MNYKYFILFEKFTEFIDYEIILNKKYLINYNVRQRIRIKRKKGKNRQ